MRKLKLKGLLFLALGGALCASLLIPVFAESTEEPVAFAQIDVSTPTPEIPISEELLAELAAMGAEGTVPADDAEQVEEPQLPQAPPEPQEPPEQPKTPQEQQTFPPVTEAPVPPPTEVPGSIPVPTVTQEVPVSTPEVAPVPPQNPTPVNATPANTPHAAVPSPISPDMSTTASPVPAATIVPAMPTPSPVPMEYGLINQPQLSMEEIDLDDGQHHSVPPRFPEGVTAKGDNETITLTVDEIDSILAGLPDGLADARKSVVLKAYSLVGHVSYYWGGKSTSQGWDERWGNPAYVSADGFEDEYVLRTYGLDCSGYVSWVFCNAGAMDETGAIGNGSSNQWGKSSDVSDAEALPGDLAFFAAPGERPINHVGIVVGKNDDGQMMVAHCSSNSNNVVVTEADKTGFTRTRRPYIFQDDTFIQAAEHVFSEYNPYAEQRQALSAQVAEEAALSDTGTDRFNGTEDQYAFGDSVILRLERAAVNGEPPHGIIIGKEGNSWIVAFPAAEGTRVVYARSEDMERPG